MKRSSTCQWFLFVPSPIRRYWVMSNSCSHTKNWLNAIPIFLIILCLFSILINMANKGRYRLTERFRWRRHTHTHTHPIYIFTVQYYMITISLSPVSLNKMPIYRVPNVLKAKVPHALGARHVLPLVTHALGFTQVLVIDLSSSKR